ncbi:ABC transporter permease [Pseudolysinimonas sp.]|uniref:ABC transporter permease n=1 Tax=Pseudolysinimonas sp. TaxID=2680009 RepID=UPI00286D31BD|nr:ABC transporter permease [Pseudolysinimonas sp.]
MTSSAATPQTERAGIPRPRATPARRISVFLSKHARTRLGLLLAAPLFWLGAVYIVALAALLVTAFWTVDSFTGEVRIDWTFDNIVRVVTGSLYQTVTLRTIGVALLVTVVDILIALPIAFFMAKVASRWLSRILVVAILMPLWASYLVKAYAWRSVLSEGGAWSSIVEPFGGETPGYGLPAVVITLAYLWLPYVILPIYAGLERVPDSLLEASGDLGAKTWRTLVSVVLPMLWPAIIAASIFSFSLSLGDYITVNIVGGTSQMLGNLVFTNVGAANNLPLAAAISLVPIAIMVVYLTAARRSGALENL